MLTNIIFNLNIYLKAFAQYNIKNKLEMDRYGEFGAVSSLFGAFKCLNTCILKVQDEKICNICKIQKISN